jgi:alpha-L-fucosidase
MNEFYYIIFNCKSIAMKQIIRTSFFILFFVILYDNTSAQQMYQPTWESLSNYKCPDWFRDVKFGIFIHWGVYSVPAFGNEWYPRQMYDQNDSLAFNHHIKKYGTQDKFGYKDFIPLFKAENFDAGRWAELFKKSGAKYIVPVAEHHDGFAMYNTSLSRWNAMNMGPKRDVIGELAAAVRKQGLIFGLSSHRIEHWWFMNNGKKFNSDVNDPAFADFYGPAHDEKEQPGIEYMNDWLLRNCELVDKYQPQVFWFDWWIEQPAMEPYRKTFAAYYYNRAIQWKEGVVLNYKNNAFPDNTAVYDIERGSSKATRKFPWQTDTSIGKKSWGWIEGEENKTSGEIIDALIDIVSKNGNLLLNIGPKPDGTISQEQENVLLGIGAWLDMNGEGIYGTRPWIIAEEGPTVAAEGSFGDQKPVTYTAEDIRFTSKGNNVFAFCLNVPAGKKINIKSLGTKADPSRKISNVELLGSSEKIKWTQKEDMLVIQMPKILPGKEAIGFRLTF